MLKVRQILQQTRSTLRRDPDRFLRKVSGVIHVGANNGQERDLYSSYGLRVVWIEPIPEVFEVLQRNLIGYPLQSAFQYLVTDRDDGQYRFHVSNNEGQSSSILDFKLHKDIWPEVAFDRTVSLRSTTLTSLVEKERINIDQYDALIMDTQGSELLILKGATTLLPRLKYIKTEVPDFESYEGCCRVSEIDEFLRAYGFREFGRYKFATRIQGGAYYDITYKRVPSRIFK